MKELYELKEMLCEELKKYGEKGDLTTGSLEVVDKLAHAVKNLDKIIESYDEEGYSEGMMPRYYYEGSYDDGMSYQRSGNRGGSRGSYRSSSYARGRNTRRDSMGRYSRDGMADKLRELMADAPDDRTREEIRRLADKVEQM